MEPGRGEERFEDFYHREYPAMVALAFALTRSRAAAEDLAQEAMTRAFRRWDDVAGYDNPGTWVRRVTINLCSNGARKLASEARARLRLGPAPAVSPPAEPFDEVWDAVRRLPAKQRAAVALHYLEDRPVAEVADILDCEESTARVHLHRGRATLHSLLEGQDR